MELSLNSETDFFFFSFFFILKPLKRQLTLNLSFFELLAMVQLMLIQFHFFHFSPILGLVVAADSEYQSCTT